MIGCAAVGPEFQKPEAEVADTWLEAHDPRVDTSSSAYQDWWAVFNDPVLDRLIAMAYAENLSLQVAGLRILEARAQLGIYRVRCGTGCHLHSWGPAAQRAPQ